MVQAINLCKARLGRDPNDTEIAEEMQVSLGSLQRLQADLRGLDVGTLQPDADEPSHRVISLTRVEAVEDDPYDQALRAEAKELLEEAIGELPGREREVLALYHFQQLTMKQVGAMMRIGVSRVSQIHASALLQLRERLAGTLSGGPPLMQASGSRVPSARARFC
jgi:RNA polymerase sigma factor for flagellar operon FliA